MVRYVYQRTYTINIPPTIPLEKVYERLGEAIRAMQAEVRVHRGRLYVTLWGTEAQVKDTWLRLKQAIAELWEVYRLEREGVASIEAIAREAGRTFPPEALVEALKLMGYDALYDRDNGVIRTTAPASKTIEAARKIAEVIDELKYRVSGTAIKRVIAAVAVGLNIDIDTIIEYGIKMKIFEKNEENKIVLVEEWRKAIRKLAVMLRPRVEAGGNG